jgi:hypothetical protein
MLKVWGTYKNSDMIEGKGPMVLDKIFMNEDDAHAYINGQEGVFGRKPPEHGWQNSRLGDWEVKPLVVLEHLQDGVAYEREQNVKRAYAKLLPQEKEAIEWHVRNALT